MPSIWITSKSRPEGSQPTHPFMRAVDSATKRREAADFDRPDPIDAGTSPSGNRTERANLRVETLISIWFMAHLPRTSSATRPSRAGHTCLLALEPGNPGPPDLALPTVKPNLPPRLPPAVRPPVMTSC